MCLAIPSRIERIDGLVATVDSAGERRLVNLMLLDGEVAVGDWVLVQNGQFAYERMDPERAREALALIDEVVAASRGADLRAW
jgi:hydrogenase expression/formation protein HypC